jgi:hypothetical protein
MPEEIKKEEELDKVPKLKTPFETYAYMVAGIFGILAFVIVMLYTWSHALYTWAHSL